MENTAVSLGQLTIFDQSLPSKKGYIYVFFRTCHSYSRFARVLLAWTAYYLNSQLYKDQHQALLLPASSVPKFKPASFIQTTHGNGFFSPHFTFASPTISEAYEDALDFDYESWIEQSKSSYHSSQDDKWMDAEAIRRHHQEMVLRAADLPEEAYELSLRDLTELPRAANEATGCAVKKGTLGSTRSSKSWRKRLSRNETMEGAGLIVKMFMPSPSGGRKKRSSGSTVAAVQKSVSINADGDGSMKNTAAETGNESDNTRSNSMPNEGHQDSSYNRKSMGCYLFFFNSSKCKVEDNE